ncbi:DUF1284 domain-containing protein [Alteribacter natronophilus]|uniref:DUF1284 domain-containing protein n=1 Tax=Alteribacter natronophilus TaxID=2583810 RepID=UPI00110F14FC|nr:DUF1284 domain-containing protein [Alteribacter natronophilus]TMW70670.1 DUF1284 domain-containing protein [Alteribacter natronophilus]
MGERQLRGHHLLCVHGFQGMGYSPGFVKRMDEIVTQIRDEDQDFGIRVLVDLDDACQVCPHNGGTHCAASPGSDAHVKGLDTRAVEHLKLKPGKLYRKSKLVEWTARMVKPDDLDHICRGCSWLSHGVCKAGIEKLNQEWREK